ncbi:glycosyltransferase family 4 protein [Marinobacter salarius]|uniref:glycosyltransferase family 4 protein n=1 Tax=Marinobacter salarius TaxID=1420917 RepID=UPI001D18EBB5|nr:glycosyltransferase family 4 protein [Marinobacter salarius]MCC4282802.1 glycosyltransferase family 4 protein [Marinobacter salarius]
MKVLAIHRFYWPDTPPYASMLRAIVGRWVSDGHEVDVLSSQPSYKASVDNQRQPARERVDGANVVRLNLPPEAGRPLVRIVNSLVLGLGVFWHAVVRKRYDVIMVSTSPPVLAGWFVAMAAKVTGARFIYHCMDIHPEIGRISGEFRNPRVFSLLSRLDRWTCTQARPVVVLSDDMAESLIARRPEEPPETTVINNFSLPSEGAAPDELPFSWPNEPFVLLFAGNIGRFQGLDALVDAMARLRDRQDIRLVMMGDGAEKGRLCRKAEESGAQVSFVGHQSVEVAKAAMARASAGFVSLVPELYRYAYPSKTMTYLEQGCPVLVAVEADSGLARDVTGNSAGVAVPGVDVDALANAISSLADDPEGLGSMRQKALEFSARAFATDVVLARWSSLLQ